MIIKWIIYLVLFSGTITQATEVSTTSRSNGRITIPEQGLSILPPPNWEIIRNTSGSSILFKSPKQSTPINYQATIQVMAFNGSRYIDGLTQSEYGKTIVEKFSEASNRVANYRLRSQEIIKLESGDEAILYYTEFTIDEVPIMQMHILISSETHHFLLTYTDLSKYFEQENSPELATAYTSMHSVVLDSKSPNRYRYPILGAIILCCLIICSFLVKNFRSYQIKRISQKLENEDSEDLYSDKESAFYSHQSRLNRNSEVEQDTQMEDLDEESLVLESSSVNVLESAIKKTSNSHLSLLQKKPVTERLASKNIPFNKPVMIPEVPQISPPSPPKFTEQSGAKATHSDTPRRSNLQQRNSPENTFGEIEHTETTNYLTQNEESEVIRLSEMIPHDTLNREMDGKKQKKGFFKKKSISHSDLDDTEPTSDTLTSESQAKRQRRPKLEIPEDDTSQIWALDSHDQLDHPEKEIAASLPNRSVPQQSNNKGPRHKVPQVAHSASMTTSSTGIFTEDAWNLSNNPDLPDRDDDGDGDT